MPSSPLIYRYKIYRGLECPIIPIGLKYTANWKKVWGYIDSGSIHSILRAEEAKRLGIEVKKGQRKTVKVGNGDIFPIYLHPVEVQVGSERFEAQIGFSRDLRVGFNVLGRSPFFEKFRICFDDTKKVITFS